jgi:D-amino-acid dehydrogenase
MGKHIVIIGGGVIGLCTAHYCIQHGHRVTILEAGPAGHDGCSFGNAGLVVPSHFTPLTSPKSVALGLKWLMNRRSPFYIRPRLSWELVTWLMKLLRNSRTAHVQRSAPLLRDLQLASRACYEEIAGQAGNDFGFVQKGLLAICRTKSAQEDQAEEAEFANRLGVTVRLMTPDEAAELEPNIRMNILGALYYPQDCHLTPQALMASLTRRLANDGAQFEWETEANGWTVSGNRVEAVATSRGEYTADEFVVCGGSWSSVIVRRLGLHLPMQAGKGYSLTLPSPPQLPQVSFLLSEARVAATPMGDTLRFGGTLEISPRDTRIRKLRVQAIVDAVRRYFPEFTSDVFDGVQPWCGLRPCTPDGLPYIGRFNRYANVWVAAGHAMIGVSLAPITGKLVAQMLSGDKVAIPVTALSPGR